MYVSEQYYSFIVMFLVMFLLFAIELSFFFYYSCSLSFFFAVVRASQYDLGSNRSVAFPQGKDLDNYTREYQDGMPTARVEITADFVQELADEEISSNASINAFQL